MTDWGHFTAWADRFGFQSLPAEPEVVVLYITDLAKTQRPSTINRRIASISIIHRHKGFDTPTRLSKRP